MKLYLHTPFAKPATHVHWYAWNDTVVSTVDSVQVAPFLHGLLLHSSTSMSQLPPKYVALVGLAMLSITVHSVVYCLMKSWPYASWLFFGFFWLWLFEHLRLSRETLEGFKLAMEVRVFCPGEALMEEEDPVLAFGTFATPMKLPSSAPRPPHPQP